MHEDIRRAELFNGLSTAGIERLSAIGRSRTLRSGEYLFLLGDSAQYISVVKSGSIDLCFPISVGGVVRDVTVESAGPGKTIGWSALVRPFRFTLSARAAAPSEIVGFGRQDLQQVFSADPVIERAVLNGIAELMANRLTMFQALWARELLRTLSPGNQSATL